MAPLASEKAAVAQKLVFGETVSPQPIFMGCWRDSKIPVHQMFSAMAAKTPDAPAVHHRGTTLSYAELNARANILAKCLHERSIGRGSLVGVFLHRSIDTAVAILAVLMTGGAYVPLDPTYPKTRLQAMFEDVQMSAVLTQPDLFASLPIMLLQKNVIFLCNVSSESNQRSFRLDEPILPSDLAYVIFTSGSTGRPKATAVTHEGWGNLMGWFTAQFRNRATDSTLIISAFGFDITQRSIVMPLVSGGVLYFLDSETFDPSLVRRTIKQRQISLLNCAPSMFYLLIEDSTETELSCLDSLRWVFLGGEPISIRRLERWAQRSTFRSRVANVYGVAECADVSTYRELGKSDLAGTEPVPIGRPIFNTTVYLLGLDSGVASTGNIGEIGIAGSGVGRGYINDPELTAQKFVKLNDRNIYRTGDLGRLNRFGDLEYVGRVDNQVKINGIRIDLGDIESAIRTVSGVREVQVVPLLDAAAPRLIAFVTQSETVTSNVIRQEELIQRIRNNLKERLPRSIIPSIFHILADLPLSPNGKIDRKTLKDAAQQSDPRIWLSSSCALGEPDHGI